MTIKFDGQSHQVDLATFTQVLMGYSDVVRAAAKESGMSERLEISIMATEPGSLDVVMSVAAQAAGGILSFLRDNKDGIEAAIIVAGGLYGFKQKLAGKTSVQKVDEKPEDGLAVVDIDGDMQDVDIRVYNTYINHPEATAAIDNSFSVLDERPEIEAMQISFGGDVMFRADHGEFSDIASSPNHEGPDIRHVECEAYLQVVKPCLVASKTRKWEFMYNGQRISAVITDDAFLASLDKQRFGMGTKMRVLMDITQEYVHLWRAYANKRYAIVKVHEVEDPLVTEPML